MLPGFVPPACHQMVPCEQGRAVGFKRRLVGPAKPKRQERTNDPAAVRLADSTLRLGEPTTRGSGQRVSCCLKATWPPCNGRCGQYPFKGMEPNRRTELERMSSCCDQNCGCPTRRCRSAVSERTPKSVVLKSARLRSSEVGGDDHPRRPGRRGVSHVPIAIAAQPTGSFGRRLQCLIQIGDQVVRGLQSDRQADHIRPRPPPSAARR